MSLRRQLTPDERVAAMTAKQKEVIIELAKRKGFDFYIFGGFDSNEHFDRTQPLQAACVEKLEGGPTYIEFQQDGKMHFMRVLKNGTISYDRVGQFSYYPQDEDARCRNTFKPV